MARLIKAVFDMTPKEALNKLYGKDFRMEYPKDILEEIFCDEISDVYTEAIEAQVPLAYDYVIDKMDDMNLERITRDELDDVMDNSDYGDFKFDDIVLDSHIKEAFDVVKDNCVDYLNERISDTNLDLMLEDLEQSPVMETEEFSKFKSEVEDSVKEFVEEYIRSVKDDVVESARKSLDNANDNGENAWDLEFTLIDMLEDKNRYEV